MTDDRRSATPPRFGGPRAVFLAFVMMNVATGVTYGSFGALMLTITKRFDTTVSVVSIGLSLVVLASGGLAPLIAMLITRFPLRLLMAAGAILATAGYVGIAFAGSIVTVLCCYGLLIGPGVALLGPLPCFTLASNWYRRGQGRALGFVGMPILVVVLPSLVTHALPLFAFDRLMLMLAAAHLLTLPLIALVVDGPEGRTGVAASPAVSPRAGGPSLFGLFRDPTFMLLIVASALMVGPTVSKNVYLIQMLTEGGLDVTRAALLLSISAATGLAGSFVFGAIADRFNAALALMVMALTQASVWMILLLPVRFPLLVLDAALFGVCAGGFMPVKGVFIARVYGQSNFALVMGASGLATLPVMFGTAPLAGRLRELTGDFALTISFHIFGLLVAALCCAVLIARETAARRRTIQGVSPLAEAAPVAPGA